MAKNQFLNWGKSLKLPKIQFHEIKFLVYLIWRVFLAWTILNFLAHCGLKDQYFLNSSLLQPLNLCPESINVSKCRTLLALVRSQKVLKVKVMHRKATLFMNHDDLDLHLNFTAFVFRALLAKEPSKALFWVCLTGLTGLTGKLERQCSYPGSKDDWPLAQIGFGPLVLWALWASGSLGYRIVTNTE